jgi:Putative adhesin
VTTGGPARSCITWELSSHDRATADDPGPSVFLAAGTPVALLIIGWTALTAVAWAAQGSYRVHLATPVRGRAVSVQVDSGQLSVGPGPAGTLRVTAAAHYALARSAVSWQSGPAGVSVRSRCRQLTGPCSFTYAVAIPQGSTAGIDDSSGDVTARGLAGRITVRAGSGDVLVSALSGEVRISDDSGNVNGSPLTGPELTDSAGSGAVGLTGLVSRDVTVTDQSGNTTLTFARVPGRVQVSAEPGDVTLVLPPGGTVYRVVAHSSSGSTAVRVRTDLSSPHVITVTDQSGNITITR